MVESKFVCDVLKPRLELEFPGIHILKQDPASNFNGLLDYILLYGDRWAMLEAKRGRGAAQQSHQEYYIRVFDELSFAAFVNPTNLDEVIHDLQSAFGLRGPSRFTQRV